MKATCTKTLITDGPNAGTMKYHMGIVADAIRYVVVEHADIDREAEVVEWLRHEMGKALHGDVMRDLRDIGEHVYSILKLATSPSVVHLLTEVLREIKAKAERIERCIEVDAITETPPRKDG